ncbi:MAG: mechanosensitive ion channel family protein, partial [Actinocrinis sp.]
MSAPVGAHMWIVVGVEVSAGLVAGLLARVGLRRAAVRAQRTAWKGDDTVVALLRAAVPWTAVFAGVWAAVLSAPLSERWRADADRAVLAAALLAATFGAAQAAGLAVRSGALARSGISGSASIFVHIARAAVFAVGFLIVLESLGVSITPLLTALGVGGLAVALALQDTLTNLFAGIHILASRKVQPGDFIQLDGGAQGYVVDTNWRNTVVRQLPNNLVIVPNAVLAASVLTNYHRPERETSVLVQVGVSYDSDLGHVEQVTCQVASEVMREVDGAVPTHVPFIRYHTFGESSIDFSVVLRADEVTAQYLIVHEFIKRLHRRYRTECIEIPYPIRTLIPAGAPATLSAPH